MYLALFKTCLVFAFCFCTFIGFSQIHSSGAPGGVKGATQWFIADTLAGECILSSQIPGKRSLLSPNPRSFGWLNHRPSLVLNGSNSLSADLGKEELHSATFFTVYQARDTSVEHLIWSIEKNKKPSLVLTTERMADLVDYKYMNFTDLAPATPKINIYGQLKSKDSLTLQEQTWNIGKIPASPRLPVSSFSGLIPEIIAFNRVLDREERLKVASYLALKYGITLTESSATYVNSSGEIIWNGEARPLFHHNIAGIGRDDASVWVQKIASSSNSPKLLSVSITGAPANNNFLLWGDNDLTLSPAPKLPGLPTFLKRNWLLTTHGSSPFWETEIVLDSKQVYAAIPAKPVYWMAIDSTGTGDFSASGIQYLKMEQLDPQGFAHFKAGWKKNKAGKYIFAFIVAQDLLLAAKVLDPSCAQPESGQIQVKILGGQAPYHLNILNKTTGRTTVRQVQDAELLEQVNELAAGKYLLKVTDARQQVYVDSFLVNPADAPHALALAAAYELPTGKTIQVNAAEKMPTGVAYHWRGPTNFESFSPTIEFNQVGIYTLSTTRNGCTATREIEVNAPAVSIFSSEVVYPNPSQGMFNVKIQLSKPAALSMSVYSAEGKLVLSKKASGADHYNFTDQLTSNGLYYIVLQSGTAVTTHKLLIIN
ncbi:MAG: T9SS type A sorting domain-containing protein [Haliscomenobacter sp.]|uniref:T9SS type A sorting domain-containing protein n=1 Tax=Haliscomenobacter sp. TaxID=2717303 RepID=UPI0029B716F6|nr:T9SS type A sorting domain-containing protein [Haliscomenobacter sp.]MDX2069122.1 T9SS type A sorting domain-containing protein [Haliscomenobacter sp.]